MIICLKSWGIFKDKEEIEEKRAKLDIKEEENIFCINQTIQTINYIQVY